MRHTSPEFLCDICPFLQEEMLHQLLPFNEFSEGHDGYMMHRQSHQRSLRRLELSKNISCTLKISIVKLVNSPHKTSPYAYKTAPIFTTITHNTPVDSLKQHMFCDLQRIARSPQIKKKNGAPLLPRQLSLRGKSPSATTLPPRQLSLRGNSPSAATHPQR